MKPTELNIPKEKFKAQFDFSNGGADLKGAWIAIRKLGPLGTLKIGQFRAPLSLEGRTGSKYTSFMERGHSMFERDGNEPVMYASFAPSQMLFKFDFWERGHEGEALDGDGGPENEVFMHPEELQIYLHKYAEWSA